MKCFYVIILIVAFLLFSSCSEYSTVDSELKSMDSFSNEFISENNYIYDIQMNLNVLRNNEPIGFVLESNGMTKQKLTISINSIIEKQHASESVLTRLYLIEDGRPIEFSVNMSDYKIENDINYEANKEYLFDIMFYINEDYHSISLLALDYPDYTPIDSSNYMYNCVVYTFFNPSNTDLPHNPKQLCYNKMKLIKNPMYGIDIGKSSISFENESIVDDHYMKDIILEKDDELFAKFNSGNSDCEYYMALLVDGRIIDLYLQNGLMLIDCEYGLKCFEYPISELIKLSHGTHTMQLIAIQAEMSENDPAEQKYDSTPVLRVIKV